MGEHGVEVREKAVELIDSGYGKVALANALAISDSIAEHWIRSYKAVGKGVFLSMGSKRRTYDRETDLCQYFGHKFLKNQAAFDSLPAACSCAVSSIGSVLSKKPSMASAGIL